MRLALFIALASLMTAVAWGDPASSQVRPATGHNGLGETTSDAGCPCRNLSETKRLDGDLGVEDWSRSGETDGTARPGG